MTMTFSNDARPAVPGKTSASELLARIPLELRLILGVVLALVLWVAAIATFGYPALIVPLIVAVPTVFLLLLVITRG